MLFNVLGWLYMEIKLFFCLMWSILLKECKKSNCFYHRYKLLLSFKQLTDRASFMDIDRSVFCGWYIGVVSVKISILFWLTRILPANRIIFSLLVFFIIYGFWGKFSVKHSKVRIGSEVETTQNVAPSDNKL